MSKAPDIEEVIARFNQGCAAFDRALVAARASKLEAYETESRTAWVEGVGALEWAVRHCLERYCAQHMTERELAQVDQATFEELLRKLQQYASPRLDAARVKRLHTCRKWRNSVTHAASLAPHRELRLAFQTVRGFLTVHLPVQEEQLAPLEEQASDASTSVETEPLPAFQAEHRQDAEAWLAQTLQEGIKKLRGGRTQNYDAPIASLEAEAPEVLTRHALALLEREAKTSEPLEPVSEELEAELKAILLRGLKSGVSPTDTAKLHRLLPLLNRAPALCVEAGWLLQAQEGLCFVNPHLAPVLVGRQLARRTQQAAPLRERVGRERTWAEAAWMAVRSGDALEHWTRLVLQEQEPLRLVERMIATCSAFGAAPSHVAVSKDMARAYTLCVSALVAFAPRDTEGSRKADQDSPWFLPKELWRRCALDLAHASRMLEGQLHPGFDRDLALPAPDPLAKVLAALKLPERFTPKEALGLVILCMPRLAARRGLMDETFFAAVFSPDSRMGALVAEPFLEHWMHEHGIPSLRAGSTGSATRLLALPEAGNPAGYLLNRPALIEDWVQSWEHFLREGPEAAVRAWSQAVVRLAGLEDSSETLRTLILTKCLARLEAVGEKSRALQALREAYLPVWPRTEGDAKGERFRTNVAILRLLGLTPPEWEEHIGASMSRSALGWRTLLSAGAPHAAIARWCIQKGLEREQAPAPYREGPVGVLATGAELLSTGPWQLAFQQAPEALDWLLREGDASALGVLADACLGSSTQPHFDPPTGMMMGLTLTLRMTLWGRVLARPAGREALYDRVERGQPLGDMHFFESEFIPDDEVALWMKIVFELWKSSGRKALSLLMPTSTPDATEARRLLSCFERRMRARYASRLDEFFEPWYQSWPSLPVKVMVVSCAAAHGVDMAGPLRCLFEQAPGGFAHERADVALGCSFALLWLSQHHASSANELLEQVLAPEILKLMSQDGTVAFWMALLDKHGSARISAAVDSLALRDSGLGLVDALLRTDLPSLKERELRPEMLRPLLIRSSEGEYDPSPSFWREAWRVERGERDIPELPSLAPGPWLTELIDQSRAWTAPVRQALLRHLAGQSSHAEVRRQCLHHLLGTEEGARNRPG